MDKDILLIVIIVTAALTLWLLRFMLRPDFFQELRILNVEISRNEGEAKEYWKAKRRRLWLSLIPFVKYKK